MLQCIWQPVGGGTNSQRTRLFFNSGQRYLVAFLLRTLHGTRNRTINIHIVVGQARRARHPKLILYLHFMYTTFCIIYTVQIPRRCVRAYWFLAVIKGRDRVSKFASVSIHPSATVGYYNTRSIISGERYPSPRTTTAGLSL